MYTNLIQYLKAIFDLSSEATKKASSATDKKNLYLKIANALRLYYLGFNQIFITKRLLSKIDFSTFSINDDEKIHIQNAGWLLDENYNNDTYISALKSNLILDLWSVLPLDIQNSKKDFFINLKNLVYACLNDAKILEDISFNDLNVAQKKGKSIDFMTPEITLKLAEKLIEEI